MRITPKICLVRIAVDNKHVPAFIHVTEQESHTHSGVNVINILQSTTVFREFIKTTLLLLNYINRDRIKLQYFVPKIISVTLPSNRIGTPHHII